MTVMQDFTDAELVNKYLAGESAAFEELVGRYFKQVFLFAKGYVKQDALAEDMAQEVFVKAWKNLEKFDKEKKFSTWLLQITKNTCIDLLRKNKNLLAAGQVDEEVMDEFLENTVDLRPLPEEIFDSKGFGERLEQIIAALPEPYNRVVRMHLLDDLTFQEIADILGQPINTIKSRYRRSLISIRRNLHSAPNNP